jgi:hypothetical protein
MTVAAGTGGDARLRVGTQNGMEISLFSLFVLNTLVAIGCSPKQTKIDLRPQHQTSSHLFSLVAVRMIDPDDIEASVKKAEEDNEKANLAFTSNLFDAALEHYSKAFDQLSPLLNRYDDNGNSLIPGGTSRLDALVCKYRSNRAAVYLKLGSHLEALRECDAVLADDPENEKALLRRCLAQEGLGRLDEALEGATLLLSRLGFGTPLHARCLELRRRVERLRSQAAAPRDPTPTHLCNAAQTLRLNFLSPAPAAVALGAFFPISIFVANEFGLFNRMDLDPAAAAAAPPPLLRCEPVGHAAPVAVEVRPHEPALDSAGRAALQVRFVAPAPEAGRPAGPPPAEAALCVRLADGRKLGGRAVLPVATLPVRTM